MCVQNSGMKIFSFYNWFQLYDHVALGNNGRIMLLEFCAKEKAGNVRFFFIHA